jgi:hypothetical protein
MSKSRTTLCERFTLVAAMSAFSAGLLVAVPAAAQWDPPPPEFVATTEPAYFEGHAAYWYNGHWFWRDEHANWNHYDREPPYLADRRAHFPPARRSWQGRR